jgi:hypothetical protein
MAKDPRAQAFEDFQSKLEDHKLGGITTEQELFNIAWRAGRESAAERPKKNYGAADRPRIEDPL